MTAGLVVTPANAALTSVLRPSWGTDMVTTPSYDGECTVCTIVRVGTTVYIGGRFTQLVPPPGGSASPVAVSNLAALDATTGEPVLNWRPVVDGRVYKLAVSPDGSRLYAVGDFLTVNGAGHKRIVALSPADGADDRTWTPAANRTVRSVAATSTTVYVGGTFTMMNGIRREKVAALDSRTGAVSQTWAPAVGPSGYDPKGHPASIVVSLALTSEGSVLVGGYFSSIGGLTQAAAAKVKPDGTMDLRFRPPFSYRPWDAMHSATVFDVAQAAQPTPQLYAAVGGTPNYLTRLDPTSGQRLWTVTTDGDVQTVAISGATVLAGGHMQSVVDTTKTTYRRVHLFATDPAGRIDSWHPALNPTVAPSYYGCWVLRTDGGDIYAGGEFTKVDSSSQPHFAIFR
jgi:outer membrane protein assembly factor BamB